MNKKILKLNNTNNIFDDIQRYLQVNKQSHQRKISTTASKHSKSLYYYSYKSSAMKNHNRTNVVTAQQTINAQILAERRKPSTSEYNSANKKISNFSYDNDFNKSLNNSLRGNTNYNSIKLHSVAGVTLNEQETKQRKQRNLNSRLNFRKIKLTQIQKQNKRLSQRLSSQQSNYSSKKLLKAYESQQSLSKRLSSSKLSNRSIISQNSSRSRSSVASKDSSISTPRKSWKNKNLRRKLKQKQRIVSNHQVKIEEHNVHKLTNHNIDKFKNLFANSFNNPIINLKAKHQLIAKQRKSLNQERKILKNPYVDIKLTGITEISKHPIRNSNTSQQKLRLKGSSTNQLSPSTLLKELNRPHKVNKPIKLHHESLSFEKGQCGGLLHRIAQQMHENDKSVKNIRKGSSIAKPLLAKLKKGA